MAASSTLVAIACKFGKVRRVRIRGTFLSAAAFFMRHSPDDIAWAAVLKLRANAVVTAMLVLIMLAPAVALA